MIPTSEQLQRTGTLFSHFFYILKIFMKIQIRKYKSNLEETKFSIKIKLKKNFYRNSVCCPRNSSPSSYLKLAHFFQHYFYIFGISRLSRIRKNCLYWGAKILNEPFFKKKNSTKFVYIVH